jgi:hypothetical protein
VDRETERVAAVPWWRSDPVWFWFFAGLFAAIAWWPLVSNSRSGLQGGDIYTYFFPLKAWYAERLREGELPLWNPLVGHGFPALGESQTGVFYPFNLLFYRFLPLGAAYNANFVLHYVLAFGFTCHYARRLGLRLAESLLVAVVFVYGWFPPRSCLEWAIVTGAWIPLALWGVESFVAGGRRRYLVATQIAVLMQLLAGHFNLAFITLVAISVYTPLRVLAEWRPWKESAKQVGQVALASVLACGVAAIQLIPSWELKTRSQRGSTEFGEQKIAYGSIPVSYLRQTIEPWRFYPHVNEPAFETKHFGTKNTNKIEAHLYFGLVPLVLSVVGGFGGLLSRLGLVRVRCRAAVAVWIVLGAGSVFLATGVWARWGVHWPGFGYFTGPGRYGVIAQLAIAVLAGYGAFLVREAICTVESRGHKFAWLAVVIVCIAIAWSCEWWTTWAGGLEAFWAALPPVRAGWASPGQLLVLTLVALAVFVAGAAWTRRVDLLPALLVLALTWADLALVAQFVRYAEIRAESPINWREWSPIRDTLIKDRAGARVLARNQNAVSLCGVATVPVYLGIGPREYFGGPLRIPDDFHWESSLSPQTVRWLEWSGVTHVLAFDPMENESLQLISTTYDPFLHELLGRPAHQPLMLYELRSARGRAYRVPLGLARQALDPRGESPIRLAPVLEMERSANRVAFEVECDEESIVILNELMYPGWRAFVDLSPVEAVRDTVFRAVPVGPGRHEIRWVYQPSSLRIGVLVTLLSILAGGVFYWIRSADGGRPGPDAGRGAS